MSMVTTRSAHRCAVCCGVIPAGTPCESWAWFDDRPVRSWAHSLCLATAQAFCPHGDWAEADGSCSCAARRSRERPRSFGVDSTDDTMDHAIGIEDWGAFTQEVWIPRSGSNWSGDMPWPPYLFEALHRWGPLMLAGGARRNTEANGRKPLADIIAKEAP